MKTIHALVLAALLCACGAGPLVTHGELELTIKEVDKRVDNTNQWVLDAIIKLLRDLFPEHRLDIPDLELQQQPPTVVAVQDELDWELILAALSMLGGTAGAIAHRAYDHKKKAKTANKA